MLKNLKIIILIVVILVGIIQKNHDLISYAQEDEDLKEYFIEKLNKKEKELINSELDCKKKIRELTQITNNAYNQIWQQEKDYKDLFEIYVNQKKEIDYLKNGIIISIVCGVVIGFIIRNLF